jgi:hypothetical protein
MCSLPNFPIAAGAVAGTSHAKIDRSRVQPSAGMTVIVSLRRNLMQTPNQKAPNHAQLA